MIGIIPCVEFVFDQKKNVKEGENTRYSVFSHEMCYQMSTQIIDLIDDNDNQFVGKFSHSITYTLFSDKYMLPAKYSTQFENRDNNDNGRR